MNVVVWGQVKIEISSLPVAVRVTKTRVLKLPISLKAESSKWLPAAILCVWLVQRFGKPIKRCQSLVWQVSYDMRRLPYLKERLGRLMRHLSQWRTNCSLPFCKNVFADNLWQKSNETWRNILSPGFLSRSTEEMIWQKISSRSGNCSLSQGKLTFWSKVRKIWNNL